MSIFLFQFKKNIAFFLISLVLLVIPKPDLIGVTTGFALIPTSSSSSSSSSSYAAFARENKPRSPFSRASISACLCVLPDPHGSADFARVNFLLAPPTPHPRPFPSLLGKEPKKRRSKTKKNGAGVCVCRYAIVAGKAIRFFGSFLFFLSLFPFGFLFLCVRRFAVLFFFSPFCCRRWQDVTSIGKRACALGLEQLADCFAYPLPWTSNPPPPAPPALCNGAHTAC